MVASDGWLVSWEVIRGTIIRLNLFAYGPHLYPACPHKIEECQTCAGCNSKPRRRGEKVSLIRKHVKHFLPLASSVAVPALMRGRKVGMSQGPTTGGDRIGAATEIPPCLPGQFVWLTRPSPQTSKAKNKPRSVGKSRHGCIRFAPHYITSWIPLIDPRFQTTLDIVDTLWLRCGAVAHRSVTQICFHFDRPPTLSSLYTRHLPKLPSVTGLTRQHIPFLSSPQLDLASIPDSPKTLSARLPFFLSTVRNRLTQTKMAQSPRLANFLRPLGLIWFSIKCKPFLPIASTTLLILPLLY